jgi:hypothetical protein
MRKIMKKLGWLVLVFVMAVTIYSCESMLSNGDKSNAQSNEITLGAAKSEIIGTTVQDATTADQQSVCVEKMGNLGVSGKLVFGIGGLGKIAGFNFGSGFKGHHLTSCATVTQSSTTFPKEIVIDYGTGCNDGRGPVMKGQVVITITDSMIYAGAVRTVKYVDFYVGDRKVDGTETVTNKGQNSEGQWVIESVTEQIITHEDGTISTRTSTNTQTWVAGFDTPSRDDDEFYRTGSSSASISDTLKYSSLIKVPLLFKAGCRTIVSGVVEVIRGESTVSIDYGNGECDNTATLTQADGTITEIDLTKCRMDGKAIRKYGEKNGFGDDKDSLSRNGKHGKH